jgi:hypothetical protein
MAKISKFATDNDLHKEYITWMNMRSRCSNTNRPDYNRYGRKGISVCPEWESFEQFYADLGRAPSPDHSIDRIDSKQGYSKENCRWLHKSEQSANRRAFADWDSNKLGVYFDKKVKKYLVRVKVGGSRWAKTLYYGPDFFEACCIRKSWNNQIRLVANRVGS